MNRNFTSFLVGSHRRLVVSKSDLNPIRPGLFEGGSAGGGGGGGGGGGWFPAAYNSKIINDNEMKLVE